MSSMSLSMSGGDARLYYSSTILPIPFERADSGVATFSIQDARVTNPLHRDFRQLSLTGSLFFMENGEERRVDGHQALLGDCLGDGLTVAHREIGYIRVQGTPRWVTFRRRRTNRKGITNDRLSAYVAGHRDDVGIRFDEHVLCRLYSTFDGRLSNDFCIHQNQLHYKGKVVGRYERRRRLVLMERFAYLSFKLEQIGGYDVSVEME
ncbi:hypothetical protein TacPo2_9 [Pantoea bacteriophage TacPo2]